MLPFFSNKKSAEAPNAPRGTVGLCNLGNTCYINSAVQCLSHCQELTEFFLTKCYKSDLALSNPLGNGGIFAESYASLLSALFPGKRQCDTVSPKHFKSVIDQCGNGIFSRYGQEDSRQFLLFLLDCLHEDLNRRHSVLPIAAEEMLAQQPSVQQLQKWAEEASGNHRWRNDSIIMDLCSGMYKGETCCLKCGITSVSFEPFLVLEVPLPLDQISRRWSVQYVPLALEPRSIHATLPEMATVGELREYVSRKMEVPTQTLFVPMHSGDSRTQLSNASDDILLVELEGSIELYVLTDLEKANSIVLPIVHSVKMWNHSHYSRVDAKDNISLNEDALYNSHEIYRKICRRLSHFLLTSEEDPNSPFITPQIPRSDITDRDIGLISIIVKEQSRVPSGHIAQFDHPHATPRGVHVYNTNIGNQHGRTWALWLAGAPFQFGRAEALHGGDVLCCEWSENSTVGRAIISRSRQTNPTSQVDSQRPVAPQVGSICPALPTTNAVTQNLHVSECLIHFNQKSISDEDNQWYCSNCQDFRLATTNSQLWRLPEILIMHLGRIHKKDDFLRKLTNLVHFPVTDFDLSDYTGDKNWIQKQGGSLVYDLFAVQNHFGSAYSGHYSAYALNFCDQKWYQFNDSVVSPITAENLVTNAACTLFYKRRPRSTDRN